MSRPEINIYSTLNTIYPIKSKIDPRWKFEDKITRGIYISCFDDSCEYIAKKIKFNDYEDEPGRCTDYDLVRKELIISKLMSENNIGPTVYDMSMDNREAFIIMDKYDGTLGDLLYLYQTNKDIPMDDIIEAITILLNRMHSLNVYHGDFHVNNIFYTKGGLISIADFGHSLFTTSQELKDRDLIYLEGIKKLADKIKQGEEISGSMMWAAWQFNAREIYWFNIFLNGKRYGGIP